MADAATPGTVRAPGARRRPRWPTPVRSAWDRTAAVLARPWAPVLALVIILALSTGARVIRINQPCDSPCTTAKQHTLIFDEAFYVNAARAIAKVHQPSNSPYSGSPPGKDPNAEHPQLAKLIMAGGIKLFGDGAWGWRIGSIIFSLIAMVALYALVLGAGGSRWLGVGAVGVMALDNLMLVHGRIATLDVYVVAMMIVAAAFWVRRRPLLAGVALGIGACMKAVAFYLLVAFVLYEAVRVAQARWGRARPAEPEEAHRPPRPEAAAGVMASARGLVGCAVLSFAAFFGLLWLLDVLVPAWDPGSRHVYAGSPFTHFGHMVKFAESIKYNAKNPGIASQPLSWLINRKVINYATTAVTVSKSVGAAVVSRQVTTTIAFRGEMNPFIIFVAIPALVLSCWAAWRVRDRIALIGAAWSVGTYLPFFVQAEIFHRTSYIFYMLVVMPGVYLMSARLFSPRYVPKIAIVIWAGLLVFGFVRLYPFRTLL